MNDEHVHDNTLVVALGYLLLEFAPILDQCESGVGPHLDMPIRPPGHQMRTLTVEPNCILVALLSSCVNISEAMERIVPKFA